RLRRPLCRRALPSATRLNFFPAATPPAVPKGSALGNQAQLLPRGYAARCAEGLRPRQPGSTSSRGYAARSALGNQAQLLPAATPPAVPSATRLNFFPRPRRLR
ncbi:MAG: hypothetical protein WAV20_23560, partial [Blastocatellia bacterium]